jgi:AcrR family transcriptional regulator
MPKPRPTTRYDVDSLVDVALEVFRTRGYDATSMEHLASAAGVAKSAFYHHVDGKETLLEIGLNRALDALFALLEAEESTTGPAIDRLRYVVHQLVELEVALLAEVSVLLRARGNTEIERAALTRRRQFDRSVARMVREAQADGDVDPSLDPVLAARLVIGMVTWAVEWFRPGGRLSGEELADTVTHLALRGLQG